jgi:hypothetical protein
LHGAGLEGISKLQQLRELRVRDSGLQDSILAQLPASLCALRIDSGHWVTPRGQRIELNSRNTVRLRQLSSLQQLELSRVVVPDAVGLLAALSQLTSLDLGFSW